MKGGQGPRVALDRSHVSGALQEKRPRQAAGSGSDLHHMRAGQRPAGARDAARQIEVEQKVLAERLSRPQPMGGDDLAERR
jgi:hypothetical protein